MLLPSCLRLCKTKLAIVIIDKLSDLYTTEMILARKARVVVEEIPIA